MARKKAKRSAKRKSRKKLHGAALLAHQRKVARKRASTKRRSAAPKKRTTTKRRAAKRRPATSKKRRAAKRRPAARKKRSHSRVKSRTGRKLFGAAAKARSKKLAKDRARKRSHATRVGKAVQSSRTRYTAFVGTRKRARKAARRSHSHRKVTAIMVTPVTPVSHQLEARNNPRHHRKLASKVHSLDVRVHKLEKHAKQIDHALAGARRMGRIMSKR